MSIVTWKTVAVMLAVLLAAGVRAAAADEYTLGCKAYDENETQAAMVMKIIRDLATVINDEYHVKLTVKWFETEEQIRKAAKSGELSFIFSSSGHYLDLYGSGKYKPYIGVTIMGMKNKANCIYVRKKSSYTRIKDLKKAKIVTYGGIFDYLELRKLIGGEPPEFFFDRLDVLNNGMSSFYALSMNEVDAAFVSQSTYKLMAATNPGPVADIRELACSFPWYDNPIFISTSVPGDIAKKILTMFQTAPDIVKKHEKLKKYSPMLKVYGIRFKSIGSKDFQPFFDLYQEGRKKGWEKDYKQWRKYVKDE